ncbi:MAG: adenylate/guanylate cyclase domain-containing protein [Verrucomicrobiota bacterium]
MAAEVKKEVALEIAHVLFIDIAAYSKMATDDQRATIETLNQIVQATDEVRKAEGENRLLKLATGDGMALIFYQSPEDPVECALQISRALKAHPELRVRMGVNSGPVSGVVDVNGRANVAGAGINMAQRVMNCGDAGHILLSRRVAEDLVQFKHWRPHLYDLGECDVKHGDKIDIVNLFTAELGNSERPKSLTKLADERIAAPVPTVRPSSGKPTAIILACALIAALVAGSFFFWQRQKPKASALSSGVPEKSIAVLPFENLSDDKQNAFFTDGVQDEILTDLAKVADLKVISRTSVMPYKSDVRRNLREIANTLGVAHVVEGAVQRAANRVRVTAQLIDARTDTHLWAQTYDRDLVDVFAIQSEIAQTIADQLKAKLSPTEKAAIAERPTADLKAYELYAEAKELLAVWIGSKDSESSVWRAMQLLDEAVKRDPNFVLAYCALAEAHENLYWFDRDRTPARATLAKEAVENAVRLRPDLGETHLAQARYRYNIFRDYQAASDELTIARRTLPNDSGAIFIAGLIERRTHRWDDSLADLRKANGLDPRNLEIIRSFSDTLLMLRRYGDQEKYLHHELETLPESAQIVYAKLTECMLASGTLDRAKDYLRSIPPDYNPNGYGSFYRWLTALYARDFATALAVASSAPISMPDSLNGGHPPNEYFIGLTARAQGDEQKARSAFADARRTLESEWGGANTPDATRLGIIARIDAALGKKDEAIREAKHAVELRPTEKDSLDGPPLETVLGNVYAWTGERDLAIAQLEAVVKIPAGPSYGDLKLNPRWDSLRDDPRFEKMVASLAPKN